MEQEAAVTARRSVRKGETIRHLSGIQVTLNPGEADNLSRDFSITVSSRRRTASLFMGPARFANHDCSANARLDTSGINSLTVVAVKDISPGEEITVSYGEDYFGADNCECLCNTCENLARNGWSNGTHSSPDSEPQDPSSRKCKTPSTTPRKRSVDSHEIESAEDLPSKRPKRSNTRRHGVPERASSNLRGQVQPEDIPDYPEPSARRKSLLRESSSSAISRSLSAWSAGVSASTPATSMANHSPRDGTPTTISAKSGVSSAHLLEPPKNPVTRRTSRLKNSQSSPNTQDLPGYTKRNSSPSITVDFNSSTPLAQNAVSTIEDHSVSSRANSTSESSTSQGRKPKDYHLTPALLGMPFSRWVMCRVCDQHFVQDDAYQTRWSCPRCERHSKLYGYQWPKTEKMGRNDNEERVVDPREINRFVYANEEKQIKKGKRSSLSHLLAVAQTGSGADGHEEASDGTPSSHRFSTRNLGKRKYLGDEPEEHSEEDAEDEDIPQPKRQKPDGKMQRRAGNGRVLSVEADTEAREKVVSQPNTSAGVRTRPANKTWHVDLTSPKSGSRQLRASSSSQLQRRANSINGPASEGNQPTPSGPRTNGNKDPRRVVGKGKKDSQANQEGSHESLVGPQRSKYNLSDSETELWGMTRRVSSTTMENGKGRKKDPAAIRDCLGQLKNVSRILEDMLDDSDEADWEAEAKAVQRAKQRRGATGR